MLIFTPAASETIILPILFSNNSLPFFGAENYLSYITLNFLYLFTTVCTATGNQNRKKNGEFMVEKKMSVGYLVIYG